MAALTYFVQSPVTIAVETQVYPTVKAVFDYTREDGEIFFRIALKNELSFTGDDYTLLNQLATEVCEEVTLTVKRTCGETTEVFWTGVFTFQGVEVDLGRCAIRVKPDPLDTYTCLRNGWEAEKNIFDLDSVAVKPYSKNGAYRVTPIYFGPLSDDPSLTTHGFPPDPEAWCSAPESSEVKEYQDPHTAEEGWRRETTWHRIEAAGTCDGSGDPVEPPGDWFTWTLLEDNCPTGSTWWRCPGETILATYNNCKEFSDVLAFLVDELDCDLAIVSDFFGINGDDTAPDNFAYDYATAYLQSLVISQKSNVKRPAGDPARKRSHNLKLIDLLHDLRILFNVYHTIDDSGNFRLEHASYYTSVTTLDLTNRPIRKSYKGQYDSLPKRELYKYMDEQASDDFLSNEILYPCGKGDREFRLRLFSTDVGFIQNPENQDIITDAGFVLIATRTTDTHRHIIDDNLPLGFPGLHENLHRHYKLWPTATINGGALAITNYRRHRKAPPLTVCFPCTSSFAPAGPVATDIGFAEVVGAELRPERDTLTLNLHY